MTVGHVCNREVIVASASESLKVAAQLMRTYNTGSVIICDESGGRRIPVGVVTDRDVMLAVLREAKGLDGLAVSQAMSKDPLVLHENEELADALMRMRVHRVRRAPVADTSGTLIGIVSTDDLLEVLVGQLGTLVHLVQQQLRPPAPPLPRATPPL